MTENAGYELAVKFHNAYERLAPQYGYETRKETRTFDPVSANGQLMMAVCRELFTEMGGGEIEKLRRQMIRLSNYTHHDVSCAIHVTDVCTCGLAEALQGVQ